MNHLKLFENFEPEFSQIKMKINSAIGEFMFRFASHGRKSVRSEFIEKPWPWHASRGKEIGIFYVLRDLTNDAQEINKLNPRANFPHFEIILCCQAPQDQRHEPLWMTYVSFLKTGVPKLIQKIESISTSISASSEDNFVSSEVLKNLDDQQIMDEILNSGFTDDYQENEFSEPINFLHSPNFKIEIRIEN